MLTGELFSARTFRVVPPRWAHDPLSGEGARRHREEVAAARRERVAQGLSAITPEEQEKRTRAQEGRKERQAKKRKMEEGAAATSSDVPMDASKEGT